MRWDWSYSQEVDVYVNLLTDSIDDSGDPPNTLADRQAAIEAVIDEYFATQVAIGHDIYTARLEAYVVDRVPWVGGVTIYTREHGLTLWDTHKTEIAAMTMPVLGVTTYAEV